VGEYLVPVRFEGGDERRAAGVGGRRDVNALGGAPLGQGLVDDLGIETEVATAKEVDDVVEIARLGPRRVGYSGPLCVPRPLGPS
jgi:hypothetical protein